MRNLLRFRLWYLLLFTAAIALLLAPIAALRRQAAREDMALRQAHLMGARELMGNRNIREFSPAARNAGERCWLAIVGRPTRQVDSLSFHNRDNPYYNWGPYGPGGSGIEPHKWTPEDIDRLAVAIGDLPSLRSLSFWKTTLPKGALMKLIPHSTTLTYLNLEETGVGDEELTEILKRVPNLERLVLSSTSISDEGLTAVAGLKKLTLLYLEDTIVTDDGLGKLHVLPLTDLNLGQTFVSERSVPLLIEMQIVGTLILPGDWQSAAVDALQQASPPKADVWIRPLARRTIRPSNLNR